MNQEDVIGAVKLEALETSKKMEAALKRSDELSAELKKMYRQKCDLEQKCVEHICNAQALEKQKNGAYSERNKLVAFISKLFPSSIEKHEGEDWEDDWRNVVFIDSPLGQVSWHIHDSEVPMFKHLQSEGRKWDGHTNEDKYQRLADCGVVAIGHAALYKNCFVVMNEQGQMLKFDRQTWTDESISACVWTTFEGADKVANSMRHEHKSISVSLLLGKELAHDIKTYKQEASK